MRSHPRQSTRASRRGHLTKPEPQPCTHHRTDDKAIDETPVWKLQLAAKAKRLVQTNSLADKLSGAAPPPGFTWGKTL